MSLQSASKDIQQLMLLMISASDENSIMKSTFVMAVEQAVQVFVEFRFNMLNLMLTGFFSVKYNSARENQVPPSPVK